MERFGVCVLGMGDCSPKINRLSEQFLTNVSRNIKQKMVNINRVNNFMSSSKQTFRLKNVRCGGNLRISGIQQTAALQINYKAMTESIDADKLKDIQENAIKEVIENNDEIKAEFGSGGADVNETSRITSTNIREIRDTYDYNDFKKVVGKMSASQEIDLGNYDIGGDCDISNISQDIKLDIVVDDISKRMAESFVELMQKNESDVDRKSKTKIETTGLIGDLGRGLSNIAKGFGLGVALPFIIGGLGIMFFLIVAFAVVMMFKKKGVDTGAAGEAAEYASDFITQGADTLVEGATEALGGRMNMFGGWA